MNKRILVMISEEVRYKEMIEKDLSKFSNLDFVKAPSKNLVECTDYYIECFQTGQYTSGLIVWITGVAVTNLLLKALPNVTAMTVEASSYLERVIGTTDILVLGEMIIGYKNLVYLYNRFLESKQG